MAEDRVMIGLDLSVASLGVVEVLCDEASDENIFYDIYRANTARTEVLDVLYRHPGTPEELMKEVASLLHLPVRLEKSAALVGTKVEEEKASTEESEQAKRAKSESLLLKIQRLTVGERVQLAMKGGKEVRSILLKDSSKEVVKKVMENPKLTESEIEMIAMSRSVPEDALRYIAKKKEWIKNYSVTFNLVSNPKTPAGVAMPFVKMLKTKDLVVLEKNKNVAEAVRAAAKKILNVRRPH